MLPKKNRLSKSHDLERVKRRGSKIPGDLFDTLFLENDKESLRVGVITSKKFSKKAVERNRAKRILLESLRGTNLFEKSLSFDLIFLARGKVLNSTPEEREEAFDSLFEKLEKKV